VLRYYWCPHHAACFTPQNLVKIARGEAEMIIAGKGHNGVSLLTGAAGGDIPMSSRDWRDTWEQHGHKERSKMDTISIRELCARIRARKADDYYQIWRTIAQRATLPEVGWLLCEVLESDMDYLHRYHCAEALLHLTGARSPTPVELSAEWGRTKNVPLLASMLEQRIGPRR
jgi:hypothetical protein